MNNFNFNSDYNFDTKSKKNNKKNTDSNITSNIIQKQKTNLNNFDKKSIKNTKLLSNIVDNFLKKLIEIQDLDSNLQIKINKINKLVDYLIDYCIKKKIYFYIENDIGYNKIITKFKSHLIIFIQNLIDPNGSILCNYLNSDTNQDSDSNLKFNIDPNDFDKNFDNYSDVNSLLFKKFKSKSESEKTNVDEKNIFAKPNKSVSFREDVSMISCPDSDNFQFHYDNWSNNSFGFNTINSFTMNNTNSINTNTSSIVKSVGSKLNKIINNEFVLDSNNNISINNTSINNTSINNTSINNTSINKFDLEYFKNLGLEKDESSDLKKISNNSDNLGDLDDPTNPNNIQIEKLSIYIKILLSQNKNLIEFTEKINSMCKIISDPNINLNLDHPDPFDINLYLE